MGSLGLSGMQSLQSVNQWISLIDTNLTNTKRIGYKETRISLKSGELTDVGKVNTSGISTTINIPSATLQISSTEILDKVQGNLTPTDSLTDFALDGEGYFVVEDQFGMKYATRDGQFHFDNDGFLVTAQGLKVLSSGQDWIRVPASEHFLVDANGRSQGLAGQSSNPDYIKSMYGTRKLMVIQIPQNNKLYYSKYGFTTFELGKTIPINLNNDFKTTMDGINPDEASNTNSTATSNYENKFFLYGGSSNLVDIVNAPAASGNTIAPVHALVTSHTFTDFGNTIQFQIPYLDNFGSFGFTFGLQDKTGSESIGPNKMKGIMAGIVKDNSVVGSTTGYKLVVVDTTGTTPTLIGSTPITFNPNDLLNLTLVVDNGKAAIELKNYTPTTPTTLGKITFNVGKDVYTDTYQTIGSMDQYSLQTAGINIPYMYRDGDPAAPTHVEIDPITGLPTNVPDYARVRLQNIQIKEYGDSSYYNMDMVGTQRSNPTPGVTNGTEHNTIDPDSAENITTQVKQQFVEESTTTVADALPELSNAQKVFSAISKIISMSNSISDDMNNLIR